jgi:hypothetical protein
VSTREDFHVATQDFHAAELGDPRRRDRLLTVADAMARKPAASLPNVAATTADLEGMYRFFRNSEVKTEEIVAAHATGTAQRCRAARDGDEPVMVVHDTTDFEFDHLDAEELGYLNTGRVGFLGHFALAVQGTQTRRPLGVLSMETLMRKQRRRRRKGKTSGDETARWKDREFQRWQRGVDAVRDQIGEAGAVVHLMDREADSFALLEHMVSKGERFVVRIRHDRKARSGESAAPWSKLRTLATESDEVLEREVPLSARKRPTAPREARRKAPRKARMARLRFSATRLAIARPRYLTHGPEELELNVVRVFEVDVPADEPAVEWLLMTTEPIGSIDDVARVVDFYRTRWVIEEFFKALKTGCAYEQRYAGSAHALLNVLAVSLPIAAHLLWIRSRARTNPDAPGTDVVTARQIEIIRLTFRLRWFPANPTARQVMLAIAEHGGHMRSNGEPGWLVLKKGFESLLEYERGWAAAGGELNF